MKQQPFVWNDPSMPTCTDLVCCTDCYLDHYYLEDVQKENFSCDCECHRTVGGFEA